MIDPKPRGDINGGGSKVLEAIAAEAIDLARVSIRQLSWDSTDRRCKDVESWWP